VWTRASPAVGGTLPIVAPQTSSRKDAARCPMACGPAVVTRDPLMVFAAGVPKVLPDASARRVVRTGFTLMSAGIVLLVARRRMPASHASGHEPGTAASGVSRCTRKMA
jgi:hypothetical protein